MIHRIPESYEFEGLADADEGADDSDDSDPGGLACGLVEVIVGNEDIQYVPDDLEGAALDDH